VRPEKTLTNGLQIVKEFMTGTNYLLRATVRLEDRATHPLILPAQEWIAGASTPMDPQDAGFATMAVMSYDGADKPVSVNLPYFNTNTTTFWVFSRTPKSEYRPGGTNVVWVSAQNQFFTLAVMPESPAPGLVVRLINLPPPDKEIIASTPRVNLRPTGMEAALVYPGSILEPGKSIERSFNLFIGPKEYHTLARLGDRFNNDIDKVMGFSGFFASFAKPLLLSMNWLHDHTALPYGWAIIAITVIIKVVFWPLTQYATRSSKRMQALGPQMKAMQEKYKADPAKLSQKQLEFWKKNKINPLSGCLPVLVQLPVLWGFYRMLQSAIELRGAPFLWIGDLSKPDTLFVIPGTNFPFNPLPLIMGATMLWQSHLAPPAPGVDPSQQKMMRYMPLMFLFMLYNYSSGLALYWTVQNLLTIVQTMLTRTEPVPVVAAGKIPAPAAPQKKK
jgi:YidC/Oxa1 family membrane protein insertase